MRLVRTPREMSRLAQSWRRKGLSIGLVPTMGALHQGHLSLMRRARRENRRVVASVFVNKLQFGPNEDFARYPRPFARDRGLCASAGADALYRPGAASMYPRGFRTHAEVEGLSELLCGRFRPGHFRGVATIVLKLLLQVRPDRLYLGEKDFQQLMVLRRMIQDMDLGVRVVACRTIREPDGLALSSRNAYLSPEERAHAPRLFRALLAGAAAARRRGATPALVRRAMLREIRGIPGVRIDYLLAVDPGTLLEPAAMGGLRGVLRLVGAIRIGRTRLIDNIPVYCGE
ncbi:MAG: pantoate--beta-alanine ligase [Elusimicrobia bacterium]|nr:pantoate--beta-alanine ligase [Elusimicrobiota bacterium]